MNRSKWISRLRWFFCVVVPLIFLCCIYANCVRMYFSRELSLDMALYAAQIDGTSPITNWWSAIFMWEGRLILRFLALLGLNCTGKGFIYLMSAVSMTLLYASLIKLLRTVGKLLPYMEVLSPALCFLLYKNTFQYSDALRLDSVAIGFLIYPIVYVAISYMVEKKISLFSLMFLVFLFVSSCCYRKPFWMIAPVYIFALLSLYARKTLMFWQTGALSFILFIILYAATNLVPLERKVHPEKIMMESDLKIACILNDDMSFYHSLGPVKEDITKAAANKYLTIGAQYSHLDTKPFLRLRERYFSYWCNYPSAMLEARCIQVTQFLLGGYVPKPLKEYLHAKYPHVSVSGYTLGQFHWPSRAHGQHFRMYIYCLILWIFGTLVPLVMCIACRRKQKLSRYVAPLLFIGCATFLSLFCYISLVVPTEDYRYHSQTFVLGLYSLFICVGLLADIWRRRISEQKEQQEMRSSVNRVPNT